MTIDELLKENQDVLYRLKNYDSEYYNSPQAIAKMLNWDIKKVKKYLKKDLTK